MSPKRSSSSSPQRSSALPVTASGPHPQWPVKNHVLLRLRQHPLTLGAQKSAQPVVTIDGREREFCWGDQLVPYWDDLSVTIQIAVPAYAWRSIRTRFGAQTVTLPPAGARSIEYAAPPSGYAKGAVGPIGSVKARGAASAIILVAINTILGTATVLAIFAGIAAAIAKASGAF